MKTARRNMPVRKVSAAARPPATRTVPLLTRFFITEPTASSVFLAGDFNAWSPTMLPLNPDNNGHWFTEVHIPPGRHEYLFVVDGEWRLDPLAQRVPNAYGGENSVVEISPLTTTAHIQRP